MHIMLVCMTYGMLYPTLNPAMLLPLREEGNATDSNCYNQKALSCTANGRVRKLKGNLLLLSKLQVSVNQIYS